MLTQSSVKTAICSETKWVLCCLRLENHTMSSSTAQINMKTSCTMLSKHRTAFSSGRPTFSEQQIRIVRKPMLWSSRSDWLGHEVHADEISRETIRMRYELAHKLCPIKTRGWRTAWCYFLCASLWQLCPGLLHSFRYTHTTPEDGENRQPSHRQSLTAFWRGWMLS